MSAGAPSSRPPWLALWLLEHGLPRSERESVVGDLLELHDERLRSGLPAGSLWFWKQTLAALLLVRPPQPRRSGRLRVPALLPSLAQDLRAAGRQLRRAPGHVLVVAGTLAVGIGATTAVFSVANPVLFRPLPYSDPDRLALLFEVDRHGESNQLGFATFADLVRDSRFVQSAAAVSYWTPVLLGQGTSERLVGQSVSHGYFATLGVRPALGRAFRASDDVAGAGRVVILSHGLWQRRFGGDSAVVERPVQLDGVEYLVAGVMPPWYENLLAPETEIWRPLRYDLSLPWACRSCRHLRVVARLRAPADDARVSDELSSLHSGYRAEYPGEYASVGLRAVPLARHLTERVRPALMLAIAAAAFVLLVAGANVANLLLARAVDRQNEFAVRSALGENRWRLVRNLFVEGWALAVLGAAGGLAVGWAGIRLIIRSGSMTVPRLEHVSLDAAVLGLALGLTVPIAVLASVGPAVLAARRGAAGLTPRSSTPSRARRRASGALVVAEIALAVVLLAGTGLLLKSLRQVLAVDPGFAADRLLFVPIVSAGPGYAEAGAVREMQARVLAAIAPLPGVRGAALASQIPLGGNLDSYGVRIEDRPLANPAEAPSADRYAVSVDYLRAMGIPLRSGRGFDERDVAGQPNVALVNETFARIAWPGETPIGKRISMGSVEPVWRTIVGVVGDVRHGGLDTERTPQFYVPLAQWLWAETAFTLVVATDADPQASAELVRGQVLAVDPELAVSRIATGAELVQRATAQRRLLLRLFEAFALAALVLAAAGIYGLVARSVAERTRELGIRLALGAGRGRIVRSVVARGAALAGAGLTLGLIGAMASAGLLEGVLFGVAPSDPATIGGVALLLAAVALLTCLVPAIRAARADPVVALRAD